VRGAWLIRAQPVLLMIAVSNAQLSDRAFRRSLPTRSGEGGSDDEPTGGIHETTARPGDFFYAILAKAPNLIAAWRRTDHEAAIPKARPASVRAQCARRQRQIGRPVEIRDVQIAGITPTPSNGPSRSSSLNTRDPRTLIYATRY